MALRVSLDFISYLLFGVAICRECLTCVGERMHQALHFMRKRPRIEKRTWEALTAGKWVRKIRSQEPVGTKIKKVRGKDSENGRAEKCAPHRHYLLRLSAI